MKKGRRVLTIIIAGIIAGILAAVAVPLYLHYTETAKVREAVGMIKAIRTSQKLEKLRTGRYYSASTVAEFNARGIDITDTKYVTYETAPTPDGGGFTITITPIDASGAAGGPMTYTYPPPEIKPYELLLTQSREIPHF